jgi:hypothetical protein
MPLQNKRILILKILEVTLFFLGAFSLLSHWVFGVWLWKAMPTHSEVLTGYTVPMIVRGTTIYLTPWYSFIFNATFWGGTLFFFAVLVEFRMDPFGRGWRTK